MRWLLLATTTLLGACTLYYGPHGDPPADDQPPPPPPPTCSDPKPPGNCTCTSTIGWACTTCPFGEGSAAIPCTAAESGTSCQIETWEHGCQCTCTADGWWECSPETIGSTCPHTPPPTGNIIEAESLASDAVGWTIAYGTVDHGGEGLFANEPNKPFTFAFTGTGLVIVYEKGPNMGSYAVSIDGGPPVAVDAFQPNDFSFQNPTTVATGLANTLHEATVSCASLYCEVDFFDIL